MPIWGNRFNYLCALLHTLTGYIVIFRLPPRKKNVEVSKFCQRFYGQDTSSGKGKYQYHRQGLLDDIPHRKLLRGVIIIGPNDLEKVLSFLEKYDATVYYREVKLIGEDRKLLNIS
jgi:hypothetical protein